MSWQNSRELQLGPNRTFKSKLWHFDNTVQRATTISIDEEITVISKVDSSVKASDTRQKVKYTPSNFSHFQNEIFKDFVERKDGFKRTISMRQNEEDSGQDSDESEFNSDEDDDKIEDGIINYDETEETELLTNKVNNQNHKTETNTQPPAVAYEMPSIQYEPNNFETTDLNCNKKLRSAQQNVSNLTYYDSSVQPYDPAQCQSYYVDSNPQLNPQCFDPSRKSYLPYSYDDQEFFKSNQENSENHFPKTYDLNNNTISCNTYSPINSNNRSPYYLASLQNSSNVIENQSNLKYGNELNDYSNISNIFDMSTTTSLLSDPLCRFNSKPTGPNFAYFSNGQFSNVNDFNSSMSSTSSSSLCSYYSMNTLHENNALNNQLNMNDFNLNQNFY